MPRTFTTAESEAPNGACLRQLCLKQLVPMALLVAFGWIICRKAATLDFAAITDAVSAIPAEKWAVSTLAAAISFWAIGRMDLVVHRLMGTGVSPLTAQLSGISSVATAQLTGFGLLTGTLARWRVLPQMTLWQAAKITGAVSVAFMAALAALCAAMVAIAGPGIPFAQPVAIAVLTLAVPALGLSVWRPHRFRQLRLPPLKAMIALLAFAALDTAAAALALYVLLPDGSVPPPALFYAVFLIALGAGLLGTTPGGVGPFELMFLACLPQVGEAPMLAAIMGYRLVYFALPALLAAGLLLAGPAVANLPDRTRRPVLRPVPAAPERRLAADALSFNAPRAEAGLLRQGEFELLCDGWNRPIAMIAPAGQCLVMLSDPLWCGHSPEEAISALNRAARERFLIPCIYKCSARTAAAARKTGWRVLPVSREAWIDPAEFDLSGPARRQLRRQLRKAHAAGVKVVEAGARPPYAEMRRIAADWSRRRGAARGFSMGRFDPGYVTGQRVYLGYREDELVGFLTLHQSWDQRALDLMCQRSHAPAGTMHALVTEAIETAREEGCPRISLAAAPCSLGEILPVPDWLGARFDRKTGAAGLARFKSSFAPVWEPLYLTAPGAAGMVLAGLDLADRISRPRDLGRDRAF
ncbi:MAG: GNAT family N-acetyltransferase [Rhodobacter sp.]|nr:GNAT family N-acetyltransferase [Rhodobacter sp.]